MKSKIFNIPQIGDLVVTKHHNAKRISLKIKSDQIPSVTIPKLMPFKMGFLFALEQKKWLLEHLEKAKQSKAIPTFFDENTLFKTRYKTLCFKNGGEKFEVRQEEDFFTLFFPKKTNIKSSENQKIIKNFLLETLRIEAKQHLPPRVEFFAQKFGFSYKKVFVKNLSSRWGSCSAVNNINLNLHLMRLPEYLSDFVILHELCHTVHKNHGEQFHSLLNKISNGKEKIYNRELKNYTTAI